MGKIKYKQRYITTWEQAPVIMKTSYVAILLGLHESQVRRFAEEGKLPAFKVGGRWRFEKSALMAMAGIKEL